VTTPTTAPKRKGGYDRSRARWFRAAQPDRWNLPKASFPRLRTLLGRALTRRCPYCGGKHVYRNWFTYKEECSTCGIPFEREEGYFVGTYAVNLVAALILGIAIVIVALIFTDLSVLQTQILGVVVAIGLPILGYPFASAIWVAIDLMVDRPENTAWEEVNRPDLAHPRVVPETR
jgi:uncharacterized protein (DUF983 family)